MSVYSELKRRNVIRIAIAYLAASWLLIQVVETLFPVYGLADSAVRLVVTLLALGFPIALIVSWLYELTPEGIKLDQDATRPVKVTPHSGSKLDRVIILLLVLALGYFAVDKFVLNRESGAAIDRIADQAGAERAALPGKKMTAPDKSIAVLPFMNTSGSQDDEYFSDGLTEELIGTLAKISGLHVTARTSAFAFKGESLDIRVIGQQLNVENVLEGSVRREGNRVRIVAQLIKAEDGFQLWSDSFDGELESMLSLQEAMARSIVEALRIQLAPETDDQFSVKTSVDPAAYDLYLKGRYHWARINESGFQQSIDTFQKAIAIDPDWAPPHAGLATVYSFMGYFGILRPREAYTLCLREANIALTLDPNSSEALVARGMAWLVHEWNWDNARDDIEQAIFLSPNFSIAHWAHAEYLAVVNPSAALDSALQALALDPLSLPIMNSVAFKYLSQGRFTEAIQIDEEMLALDPYFAAAHWNLGLIHLIHKRFDAAKAELLKSVEYSAGMPSTLSLLAYAHARSGDTESALLTLEKLKDLEQQSQGGYAPALQIAFVYEGLGRTNEALDWLEQAFVDRDGWLIYLNTFPRFQSMRAEPRFQDLLGRLNLPEIDSNETAPLP